MSCTEKNINEFLATNTGHDYVLGVQENAYKDIESNMKAAMETESFKKMTREEQVHVLGTIGKASNQAGSNLKYSNGNLTIVTGKVLSVLTSSTELVDYATFKVKANEIAVASGMSFVVSGIEHTTKGTDLYNQLYSNQSEIGKMFRGQLENDPYALSAEVFKGTPQEQFMDTMFRYPAQVPKLIGALNEKGNYQINPSFSTKYVAKTAALADEVYTVGVKDGVLFSIDKEGNAHKLDSKGQWIAFDNNKNPLVHRTAKGQWTTNPRDLKQDHTGPEVLELQQKLNALNLPENQLTIDEKNPTYNQATTDQIKAFQAANQLPDTGICDKATRALMDQQLNEKNKNLPFVRTQGMGKNFEQDIASRIDHINTLNAERDGLDAATKAAEIAKIDADIRTTQTEIAQLELDRQQQLDDRIKAQQDGKESLAGEMALGIVKVAALSELNDQLKGLSNTPENLTKAENLAKEAGITLATPAEVAMSGKETLDLTNKADITALQNVLHERGLLTATARGTFGNQTKASLRTALDLPEDHQFSNELSHEALAKLLPRSLDTIQEKVGAELTKVQTNQTALETKSAGIDKTIADLEAKQPSVYAQKIAENEQAITANQSKITEQQQQLTHLSGLNDKLTNGAANAASSAYDEIKAEVKDTRIFFDTPLHNGTEVFKEQTKQYTARDEVKEAQDFLKEQGHLQGTPDGKFGRGTGDAVEAYKRSQGLTENLREIDQDFRTHMQGDLLKTQSRESLSESLHNQQNKVTATIGQLEKDNVTATTNIAELRQEEQGMHTTQLTLQQAEQTALTQQLTESKGSLEALKTIEQKINGNEYDLTKPLYDQIKTALPKEHSLLEATGDKKPEVLTVDEIKARLTKETEAVSTGVDTGEKRLASLGENIKNTEAKIAGRAVESPERVIAAPDLETPQPAVEKTTTEVPEKAALFWPDGTPFTECGDKDIDDYMRARCQGDQTGMDAAVTAIENSDVGRELRTQQGADYAAIEQQRALERQQLEQQERERQTQLAQQQREQQQSAKQQTQSQGLGR